MEVLTNSPIRQVLLKQEQSGWLDKWVVKLGEYDIDYKLRTNIKAQALEYFITIITSSRYIFVVEENNKHDKQFNLANKQKWILQIDGYSNVGGQEMARY